MVPCNNSCVELAFAFVKEGIPTHLAGSERSSTEGPSMIPKPRRRLEIVVELDAWSPDSQSWQDE
jgi:hypothetical protein